MSNFLQQIWRGVSEPEPSGYNVPDENMDLWGRMQEALAKNPTPYDISMVPMPMRRQVSPLPTQPPQRPEEEVMGYGEPQVQGITSGYGAPVITASGESMPVFSGFNPEDYAGVGDWAADYYTSRGHGATADRARLLAEKALQYHLDPYFATALGAQEGGWLSIPSPYAENNYLGLGQRDDVSLDMGAATFEEWLDHYLPKIAHDPRTTHVHEGETPWGHRNHLSEIGGANSPYLGNYNYYDSWLQDMILHMNKQEQHRQQYYPDLGGPMIGY